MTKKSIIKNEPTPYDEKFSEKQIACIDDWQNPSKMELCYEGGARSGKTWIIGRAIIDRAINYPGSRCLIARYRFNHLVTTVWMQTLIPMLEEKCAGNYKIDKQYFIITLWNGSTIWGAGLDEKERVEKIMGSEYSTIFINEATQVSFDTYQKLKTRLSHIVTNSSGKTLNRKIIVDCNPRNEFHWIYKYFILHKDPLSSTGKLNDDLVSQIVHRKWFPWDNPFLSKDYIEILKNLSGAERQRLYEGQWVNQEGLVYPTFQDAIVEPFEIPDKWEVVGAVDFGYTNPFAFIWVAYDSSNETYYCYDEYYVREKTVHEHCKELSLRRKCSWIVADHDAEDRATMKQAGFHTIPAVKDVSTGIQAVKKLIDSKHGFKLRIFRSCVNLVEEMSVYSWDKDKEGKNAKEQPVKFKDHALDALRYLCKEIVEPRGRVEASIASLPKEVGGGKSVEQLRRERAAAMARKEDSIFN